MTSETWKAIEDAYLYVLAGKAKRLDGDGWTVYAVGSNLIRVDVRVKS